MSGPEIDGPGWSTCEVRCRMDGWLAFPQCWSWQVDTTGNRAGRIPLMTTTLMPDETRDEQTDAPRDAIAARVRAHRERRARRYGRDRNEVELDTSVQREAQEFQAKVQRALRDAS